MSRESARCGAVLAVDGGNSKTEVVLLDRAGGVLGMARGPGSNHAHSDFEQATQLVDELARRAARAPSGPVAELAVLCLAGADYPSDERRIATAAWRFGWAERLVVRNDALAMLRAGTDSDAAVALICGAGINCAGVAPTGRTYRFPALGDISGDWGGGYEIGMAAFTAAVRAEDGRGPRTSLTRTVPRHFGVARPAAVVSAIYQGRIHQQRLAELAPLVFEAADDGDAPALAIVDRLVDELVTMVRAVLKRLRLTREAVDVVLGGGVLTAGHVRLNRPVTAGILAVAPRAEISVLRTPPVAGAALIGFDQLDLRPTVDVRKAISRRRKAWA